MVSASRWRSRFSDVQKQKARSPSFAPFQYPKKTAGLATRKEKFLMKVKLPIWLQIAVLAVAVMFPWLSAKAQGGSLQSQLEAKYTLTKPTDDKSDIVTAGAVLVLEKDKLIMYPTSNQVLPLNTYRDGRLSEGAFGVHHKVQSFGSFIGHPLPDQAGTAELCDRREILGNENCRAADGVLLRSSAILIGCSLRLDSSNSFSRTGRCLSPDQVLKTGRRKS